MSSKIKVDTIENVAGSGNVSLGSGHNLVVPGNITGQGTAAITSNATVGGTLDVTGDLSVTQYIRHVGDTDTHLRFAGANDLRIVSGNVEHAAFDGTIVFNQSGADMDFRVESNSNANMLFVDAGNNRVGIGTNSPDNTLHVHTGSAGSVTATSDGDDLVVENSGNGGINILSPDANRSALFFGHASDNNKMQIRHDGATSLSQIISDDTLTFNVGGGAERIRIDTNGKVGIGGTPSVPLHIQASGQDAQVRIQSLTCLLYTSPSPRD